MEVLLTTFSANELKGITWNNFEKFYDNIGLSKGLFSGARRFRALQQPLNIAFFIVFQTILFFLIYFYIFDKIGTLIEE